MGEDAKKMATVIDGSVPVVFVSSMQEAVNEAYNLARASDDKEVNVLLSPACASFDMFKNYIFRGEAFIQAVNKLQTVATKEEGAMNA